MKFNMTFGADNGMNISLDIKLDNASVGRKSYRSYVRRPRVKSYATQSTKSTPPLPSENTCMDIVTDTDDEINELCTSFSQMHISQPVTFPKGFLSGFLQKINNINSTDIILRATGFTELYTYLMNDVENIKQVYYAEYSNNKMFLVIAKDKCEYFIGELCDIIKNNTYTFSCNDILVLTNTIICLNRFQNLFV